MYDAVETNMFRFVPRELLFGIERAAAREGHAKAMVASMVCEWHDYDKSNVPI